MAWNHPKTNWAASEVVGTADLTRIENNTQFRYNYIAGLEIQASNYMLLIQAGMVYIEGVCYNNLATTTKYINVAWTSGAPNYGGKPSGLSLTDDTWYHIFALGNPTTGSLNFAIDDNITFTNITADANISAAGFTKKRRIASVYYHNSTDKLALFSQRGGFFSTPLKRDSIDEHQGVVSTSTITLYNVPSGSHSGETKKMFPSDIIVIAKMNLILIDTVTASPTCLFGSFNNNEIYPALTTYVPRYIETEISDSTIYYDCDNADTVFIVESVGYFDPRGEGYSL